MKPSDGAARPYATHLSSQPATPTGTSESPPALGRDAAPGRPPWVVPLAPRPGQVPRPAQAAAAPPARPAAAPPGARPAGTPHAPRPDPLATAPWDPPAQPPWGPPSPWWGSSEPQPDQPPAAEWDTPPAPGSGQAPAGWGARPVPGEWDTRPVPGPGQAPAGWGARPVPGWGPPPTPPRRRRAGRVLAALAAMVVLVLVAISLVARPAREPVAGPRPVTGRANAPARSDPSVEVNRLLQTRARAILARDKAAFLGVVDRRRASYFAAQSRLFDRMATAPFAAFSFRIVNPSDDLATASVRRRYAPARVYLPEVQARYRFVGQDDSPVLSHVYYTFVQTADGWRIGGQGEAKPFGTDDVEIWDGGPLRGVRSARTLVVYHPGEHTLARRLLAAADNAYAQIARSWSQPWERKVVILVPSHQDEAERLAGADDLTRVAAVSSSSIESVRTGADQRVQGNRIIVNTANIKFYDRLNLQVVATHEMTHVATRRLGGGVPMYLVEGFADYVALRGVPAPFSVTRPALTKQVHARSFDDTLPANDLFRGSNDLAVAYDQGSSFCLWVATTHGNAKLQALYRAFAGEDKPTPFEQDARFRRVLGIGFETAEARWAAWVRRQL